MASEKREFPRKTIAMNICIKAPVLGSLVDVSRTGARLTVENPQAIPDEFMIALNPDLHRWCRVVWRKDNEIGVKYLTAPAKYREWFPIKRDEAVAKPKAASKANQQAAQS
jgi:PilZ domain